MVARTMVEQVWGWPELGFKVLLDIMDNKLNHVHVYICVFK